MADTGQDEHRKRVADMLSYQERLNDLHNARHDYYSQSIYVRRESKLAYWLRRVNKLLRSLRRQLSQPCEGKR